jgi:hypothetical protein
LWKLRRITDTGNGLLRNLRETRWNTHRDKRDTTIRTTGFRGRCGLDSDCIAIFAWSLRSFVRRLVTRAQSTATECELDSNAGGASRHITTI